MPRIRTHTRKCKGRGFGKNEKEQFTCAKFVRFACCGCTHFGTHRHTHTHKVIHTLHPPTHLLSCVIWFSIWDYLHLQHICQRRQLWSTTLDSTRLASTWFDLLRTRTHTHSLTPTLLAVRVIGSCTYCQQLLVAKRLQEPQRNCRKTNMATFPSWLISAPLLAASRGPTSTTTTASAPSRRAASYQSQCPTRLPRSCGVLSFLLRVWAARERERAKWERLLPAFVGVWWVFRLPRIGESLLNIATRLLHAVISRAALQASLYQPAVQFAWRMQLFAKLCKESVQISGPMSLLALLGKHVTRLGVLSPPLVNTQL